MNSVLHELAHQGGVAVVAEPARVDAGGDEGVPQGVHRDEGGELPRVAEVVGEVAPGEGGAGRRLGGDEAHLLPGDLVRREGEGRSREVAPAPAAADHDVRTLLARDRELLFGLEPDHGLVEHDVVEDAPEGVLRVVVGSGVLDGLADGDPQASRRVRVFSPDGAPGVRLLARAGDDAPAPGLDHGLPVGLLLITHPDHVDLAGEAEDVAGEGAPPLAGARLGGEPGRRPLAC